MSDDGDSDEGGGGGARGADERSGSESGGYSSRDDDEDGSQASQYDTEDEDGVCERGEGDDEEVEVEVEEEGGDGGGEGAAQGPDRVASARTAAEEWEKASSTGAGRGKAENRIVRMIEARMAAAIRADGKITAAEAHRLLLTGLGAKSFIGAYVVIPHRDLEAQHVVAEIVPAFDWMGDKAEVGFRAPSAIELLRRIIAVREAMQRPKDVDALAGALGKL